MTRSKKKQIGIVCLLCFLLLGSVLLTGCANEEENGEAAGKGFFRDVNFGMTLDEVIEAEKGRSDSGNVSAMLEYSCQYFEHIRWDGYDANVYYIANADGVHLDTILISVNGGLDFTKTKKTLERLYTDGSSPEQSDDEYYVWSNESHSVLAQANADGTAMITLMAANAVPAEGETDNTEETK